ncbi:MAG TPA: DNA primase [Chlamydiales bacterium]|nr:DNA primase [Chlamydiales bacterium]
MGGYSKESLETLRNRIDLVEVLSSHIQLQRSGSSYKAICPFHDEKTPSFVVQKGDTHYHCFGCQAHGDAIQFLMTYMKLGFVDAVEMLAEKFGVVMERTESKEVPKGPSKSLLKEIMDKTMRFYHFLLLHTEEGHKALQYLYERGIDLDFIETFQIGFSLKNPTILQKFFYEQKISKALLIETGLVRNGPDGKGRDFFTERVMIPIKDPMGAVIGFTARKIDDSVFGGKYINSPETPLFKKSKVLFGLNESRRAIAKEKKAVVVEGQIDALRLIYGGYPYVVAPQGTAFCEEHVQELKKLGVEKIYLAFDSDKAGVLAACKAGDLFQKEAIEVLIVNLPAGMDPDSYFQQYGLEKWLELIENAEEYLSFLVRYKSSKHNMNSPAGKNELVRSVADQIKKWNHPLMVHESLKKLSDLTNAPLELIGSPVNVIRKSIDSATLSPSRIDPELVLEADVLRWIFLLAGKKPKIVDILKENVKLEYFTVSRCRKLFQKLMVIFETKKKFDVVSLILEFNDVDDQNFIDRMLKKKMNIDVEEKGLIEALQKLLDRHWMRQKESVQLKIQMSGKNIEDSLKLAKDFDELNKNRPIVKV